MIPRQKVEEILEAIWKADEAGEFTLGSVRRHCPEEISDSNLRDLETEALVIRQGERIARIQPSGNRLFIELATVEGNSRLVVLDQSNGKVLGSIDFPQQP